VHTDGGCLIKPKPCNPTDNTQPIAAIGVYWSPGSPFNVSQLCKYPPFTNQRTELEAVSVALNQAVEFQMKDLILITDSNYATTGMNQYEKDWIRTKTENEGAREVVFLSKKRKELVNQDLWERILSLRKHLTVHVEHVPRAYNREADALATQALQEALRKEATKEEKKKYSASTHQRKGKKRRNIVSTTQKLSGFRSKSPCNLS
jgi:ribonuclease HI